MLGSREKLSEVYITSHVWSLLAMVNSKKDVADKIKMWGDMCT